MQKINEFKYGKRKPSHRRKLCGWAAGRVRFGKIVSFVHPEGLYMTSNEKGYNGKDLIECVEINPRKGLTPKGRRGESGASLARTVARFAHLANGQNGGVRIKLLGSKRNHSRNHPLLILKTKTIKAHGMFSMSPGTPEIRVYQFLISSSQ